MDLAVADAGDWRGVGDEVLGDVLTWSRLHGFVSLEIAGNYASMGIDPDQLFETELKHLAS